MLETSLFLTVAHNTDSIIKKNILSVYIFSWLCVFELTYIELVNSFPMSLCLKNNQLSILNFNYLRNTFWFVPLL